MPNIEMNLCSIVLLALLPLATADLTVDVQPCALPMEPNTTTGSIVITNSTAEVNETCTITIPNIEKSEQISLYLHQLKSPSPNLFYVYDGVYNSMLNDTNTKLLYNSTGKTGPVWMVIFSNVSTIVFNRTDNDVENITIDFDSEKCVQTVSSGEISPPHFLPDTADLSCSYDLNQTLESSYVGVLSFLTFDISDGSIMMDNSTRYSGSTLPKDTFLTKPDVNVDLSLKKSNKSQTFSGLLSQVVKDCSEIINVNITQDYTIQIPSQHYLVTECRLIFTSHNAKQLKVELHTVKLHGADHLNLADGDSQGDRDMVGGDYSLADTSTGNIFLTSGSSVWVRLVIDTLPGKREVKLRVSESDGDGRYYDQGKLTLGASKKQAGTFDYYYQLVTSTQVEVSLNQTSLKSDGSIEFYDGLQTTSKLITSFGADSTFYPVTSSKGELLIVARNFTTEQIPATFQNVIGSCNVDTSERTGSYSLLKLTQDEKKCMWTISPQTGGEVIALQLLKINLRNNDTLTVSSIGTATTSQILSKFTGPMLTSFIPQINIPSDHRTQITFSTTNNCNGSACTNPTVMAGYSTVKACNGPLSPPSGVVTSPNWPNVYPLNAECIWSDIENATTSKNKLLHVSFSKFNLPNNHSLTLTSSVDKTPKPKVLTLTGSQVPDDVIVKGVNYTLTFSSVEKKPVLQSSVGEGFVLNYKYLECGGSITTAKDVIMSPDYPKPNNKSQICAWTIHIPDTSNNKTANILQFDLILDNKNESVKSLLEIHDGGSINDPVMILSRNATLNKTRLLSRTNKLFILYDNTATGTLGLIFHMNYSTHECNIFCDNGVCLHKDWRCNGINECGDNTDEIDCKGPGPTPAPTPTPAPHKGGSGVASYWVALCLLFGIVMGVVGVIFLPRIYRRLRFRNYNTLHEVNNPVA